MAKKIKVALGLERQSVNPIDNTFVLSKAEMLSVDDARMPNYYFCVCSDDGKFYTYDKSATPSAETGKFKALENGGGGMPEFIILNWAVSGLNLTIPVCTADVENTAIPKFMYTMPAQYAADYKIAGLIAYEISDANSKRLNFMSVCQFTGNNQTELNVRGCVMGTTPKVAAKINAWVLLAKR